MRQGQMLVALAVVSHFLVACQDSSPAASASNLPTAPDAVPGGAPAVRSSRPLVRVSPVEFHARNQMDWVGVLHNAAMDQLRTEVRQSKPKDLCKAIERISAEAADAVGAKSHLPTADRRKIGKSAFDKVGCRGKGAPGRNASADHFAAEYSLRAANVSQVSSGYVMSSDAWAFVDQITAAGESAGSAGELASELSSITADAQGLSADDQSVIEAMASVSLSSYEYWEQNAVVMAGEMADAYGSCIGSGGGESCYYASSWRQTPLASPAPFLLASNTVRARACEIDARLIWTGDKWGAGAGLAAGLATRTVQGAIIGLLGGAAAGSAGAATYELGRFVWCAYR